LKKLLSYITDFIEKDFSVKTYLAVLIFLVTSISLNYFFKIENQMILLQKNRLISFLLYIGLYSFAYYGILTIYYLTEKINYFSSKEIMIKSFLAILLLSFDGAFMIKGIFIQTYSSFDHPESKYLAKLINQSLPSLAYLPCIFFFYKKYDQNSENFYGFSAKNFSWEPYILMFLLMLPLLFIASFQKDFIHQYPFFKYWNFEPVFGLSQKNLFSIYEFFYLFNFINVELLFRGLLIIGLMKCMGQRTILPMIVLYAFLHFGKPLAETISSALGGYILGVIAFRTNNIFGGFLIHIYIAFLMDIFAILRVDQ
jgi:hypothetical protein